MSIFSVGGGNAAGYDIEQSLRFDDGGPAYMDRTPSSAGNRKTWTWSSWVKRGNLGSIQDIFVFGAANTDQVVLAIHTDKISFSVIVGNTTTVEYVTTQVLRDPSAWYHIVVSGDTTPASPLFKVYLNGEQVTDFSTSTNIAAQNLDTQANNTVVHRIGERAFSSSHPFDGYLAEVHWIDGQALTPASFGETNSATNQWVPIEVTGMTYGTNGFYLPFSSTELANSFTDSSRTFIPTENITADYLVIGGGGGGGNSDRSGGGGAGGYRTSAGTSGGGASAESSLSLTSGSSYAVTVGAGGAGNNSGSDSSIIGPSIDVTSLGGGKGADADSTAASSGGSGGGGGMVSTQSGASGTSGQGYAGGAGSSSNAGGEPSGGGGGGAGAVGVDTAGVQADGGAGGAGVSSSITGSAVTRAGGGGGGAWTNNGGAGGSGGGGAGGKQGVAGSNGTANTGGGGGGDGQGGAGSGGSGIVIIRYAGSSPKASGGTITSYTDGGTTYQVHTFTSSAHTITANGDVANTRAPLYKIDTFTSNGSWTKPSGVTSFDVLVVAGGGSGGRHGGAGGGAGGLIYAENYTIPDGTYSITIGSGGTGATGTSNTDGDDSSIGSLLVAKGGGKGVNTGNNPSAAEPYNGGSGAGSANQSKTFTETQTSQSGDSGTYGFGNDGGKGYTTSDFAGGGGGGAGSAGSDATSGLVGGNGGSGKTLSISGSSVTYAGGGGGSHHDGGGTGSGGSGGGGNGTGFQQNGGDATG